MWIQFEYSSIYLLILQQQMLDLRYVFLSSVFLSFYFHFERAITFTTSKKQSRTTDLNTNPQSFDSFVSFFVSNWISFEPLCLAKSVKEILLCSSENYVLNPAQKQKKDPLS